MLATRSQMVQKKSTEIRKEGLTEATTVSQAQDVEGSSCIYTTSTHTVPKKWVHILRKEKIILKL